MMANVARLNRRLATAMMFCATLLSGAPALAHAMLMTSDPLAGVSIQRSPHSATLTFDEPVETSLGSLRVIDSAGIVHSVGAVTHPGGDARRVAVVLSNMVRGRYVVAWQVVSADSHMMSGAYAFGVGASAGESPIAAVSGGPSLLLPVLKFVLLAGALLGIGLPIGAATIARTARRKPMLAEFTAWIVVACAAISDVALRGYLAGGSFVPALTTHVGVLRVVTIGAALLGLIALTGVRRNWLLLTVASIAAAVSLTLAGHAAQGAFAPIGITADLFHLLAAASWIGVLAIATTLRGTAELRGITRVAASAVGILILTGTIQTIRNVGSIDGLLTTVYGRAIDLKIALLIVLLVLALTAQRMLARGGLAIGAKIKSELWLLTVVVLVTAVLVESPLPREVASARTLISTTLTVRNLHVRVTATPIDARHWNVLLKADGPLDAAEASLSEERKHVGPLPIALARQGRDTFAGTASLPFGGVWQILASVSSGAFDESHANLDLPESQP